MDKKDLVKRVKEDNVKFISLQFTDVMGSVKSVDMPVRNLQGVLDDGAWFDGSSVEGFARIQESEMRLSPTPIPMPCCPGHRRSQNARAFSATSTPRMALRLTATHAAR